MIPQHYIITKAEIRNNKISGPMEIVNLIADVIFYESIYKPYITGSITMLDDGSVIERLQFRGTEEIDIAIQLSDTDFVIERTFKITSINVNKNTNDKSSVLLLQLLDVHAFVDASKKISKAYTGKMEDIITQILIGDVDMGVDRSYMEGFPSVQEPIRVITPYVSPLQACNWLKSRLTTVNGSPFFLYASLFDENIRLGNFDGMMIAPVFNDDRPFLYASAGTNFPDDPHDYDNAFIVSTLEIKNEQNAYEFMSRGGLAADITVNNIQEGTNITHHFTMRKMLERLQENDIIPNTQQIVFDDTSEYDESNVKEMSNVICSKTYESYNNYHDVFDESQAVANVQSMALVNALERNKIVITIPGLILFGKKVSVGDKLRLDVLTTDVNINEGTIDKIRSGEYLILNTKHAYMNTQYYVTLTISKLTEVKEE